ncbi:MAG: hypothetical protein JHC26_04950 [Thermofilum sp.]|jgi:hypothetical protein|uniref:hypothetical protein n=1 Tax=Thermofilum sp. TaxID=1961369 RepID=UPI00258E016A|nr:hypothetical protein [Thermofilum sp.]MCI4408417.1 hypothetical protein [Thermofilum sp.]
MSDDWEVVDEDEETVGEDEENVSEEEEVVDSEEEAVKDETITVGYPSVVDHVYAYILGMGEEPKDLGGWQFDDLFIELRKAEAIGDKKRAKRIRKLIFMFCPYKPRRCPIYTIEVEKCPFRMEKSCRAYAYAYMKKHKKNKSWFLRGSRSR